MITSRTRLKAISACLLTSFVMAGCASTKEAVLPQDGPTMSEIYHEHQERSRRGGSDGAREALASDHPHAVSDGDRDLYGYTRDAAREVDSIFQRLPNPTLVMYVYPHLAGRHAVPIPGYSTTFTMYERTEFALPGEAPCSGC